MSKDVNGKKVTIYIMDDDIKEIEKLMKEHGLSFSGAIRFALKKYFKNKGNF